MGHPDFGRLVPCSCQEQALARERATRLLRYSNLGPLTRLTFDSLVANGRSSDPANQERFRQALAAAKDYAEDPRGWLMLAGVSGCGKTHLAAAIANRVLERGQPVFFILVADLLDHLRSAFGPESDLSYDQLFELVRKVPLLILDDLGGQSSTPWAQEKLFQLLNHRYNAQLPTVITTNQPLEAMEERLRTRLTDPALCRVYVVEERSLGVVEQWGTLDLPLLREMTFENFDYRGLHLPRDQRQNLAEAHRVARDFAENPEGWLVLTGTCGCGKTHLAAAIANYQRKRGQPVLFVVVPDLLDHLRSTFSPESRVAYDELFEQVRQAPLLVLDDFGSQTSSPWAQEKLYQVINYRYNARLATVITTNLELERIEGRFSSRMLDPRVSNVFAIIAPDYRSDMRPVERPAAAPRRRQRSQ